MSHVRTGPASSPDELTQFVSSSNVQHKGHRPLSEDAAQKLGDEIAKCALAADLQNVNGDSGALLNVLIQHPGAAAILIFSVLGLAGVTHFGGLLISRAFGG